MKARCLMEIDFPDGKSLDAAVKAIEHEGGRNERSETRVEMDHGEKRLTLHIEAKDVVALRAAMNAFMRAFSVFEGIEGKEDKAE